VLRLAFPSLLFVLKKHPDFCRDDSAARGRLVRPIVTLVEFGSLSVPQFMAFRSSQRLHGGRVSLVPVSMEQYSFRQLRVVVHGQWGGREKRLHVRASISCPNQHPSDIMFEESMESSNPTLMMWSLGTDIVKSTGFDSRTCCPSSREDVAVPRRRTTCAFSWVRFHASVGPQGAAKFCDLLHEPWQIVVNCRSVKWDGSRAWSGRETAELRNLSIFADPKTRARLTATSCLPRVSAKWQVYHSAPFRCMISSGFARWWVLRTGGSFLERKSCIDKIFFYRVQATE
jgi:hypothetical protein